MCQFTLPYPEKDVYRHPHLQGLRAKFLYNKSIQASQATNQLGFVPYITFSCIKVTTHLPLSLTPHKASEVPTKMTTT
jgi:hypothetical protein